MKEKTSHVLVTCSRYQEIKEQRTKTAFFLFHVATFLGSSTGKENFLNMLHLLLLTSLTSKVKQQEQQQRPYNEESLEQNTTTFDSPKIRSTITITTITITNIKNRTCSTQFP